MIDLIKIQPGSVFHALSDRRDLVDRLIKKDEARATPDALLGMIFRGGFDVHGIFLDQKLVGFSISGITQYAKGKALIVYDVVTDKGVFAQHAERLFELLDNVAKFSGCQWVDFHGRPGWINWAEAAGYKARQVVFTKEV